MRILLLVDIQNDFCPGGSLAVPDGDQVVAVANRLMRSGNYDCVIASKDWHPENHISFAANHKERQVFETISIDSAGKKLEQTLWPIHCVEGTAGAEYHPDLLTKHINHTILKGTRSDIDSYSAFYDNAKLNETALNALLHKLAANTGKNISEIELHICGLATDYCVAATARDAIGLGYNTSLIIDACRAVNLNPNDELNTLRDLVQIGVALVSERDIIPIQLNIPRNPEIERGLVF